MIFINYSINIAFSRTIIGIALKASDAVHNKKKQSEFNRNIHYFISVNLEFCCYVKNKANIFFLEN